MTNYFIVIYCGRGNILANISYKIFSISKRSIIIILKSMSKIMQQIMDKIFNRSILNFNIE